MKCPVCGEILIEANIGDGTVDVYCEECGYPDEELQMGGDEKMNEAYSVGFKDGASAGYKLAIEDMKLDKKPQIMKKYEGDYSSLLDRHNALVDAVKKEHLAFDALDDAGFQLGLVGDYIWTDHAVARAEVDHLLQEEKP